MIINSKKVTQKVIFGISLIILDQFSKYIIRQSGGLYICNEGIAFGLRLPNYIFWLIWITSITGLLVFLKDRIAKKEKETIGIILILSGAIANFIDRILFGCVIDFIDIKIFNYPLFNLADCFIFIGCLLVIIKSFKEN